MNPRSRLRRDRRRIINAVRASFRNDGCWNHDRNARFIQNVEQSQPSQEYERRGVHDTLPSHARPPASIYLWNGIASIASASTIPIPTRRFRPPTTGLSFSVGIR